ncbi:MAG: Asp23/Gls24 family envelope stress response protein [Mogibacterium sp.]|nr:Asp23/Gls24 family envelope stress response protein [Mogibacterium sp.]
MNDEARLIEFIESEVLAFSGVSRFADASLTENIQVALGLDIPNPSIRISEDDGKITISIEIIVYYGVNIPQLCYDIQTKVRNNIRELTGLDIKAVNIKVEGIDKE